MDSIATRINEIKGLMAVMGNAVTILERDLSLSEYGSEDVPSDPKIRSPIYAIEAACAQLSALVARPADALANKFLAFTEPACLQVVLSYKIPDILQEYSSGTHVSELDRRTGLCEAKLSRILRFLAAKHVFQEVGPNVFANNRLSRELVSSNPLSSLGLCMTDVYFKAGSSLGDVLNDPKMRSSTSPLHTAFSKYYGPKTFYDSYAGPSSESTHAHQFSRAMMGWNDVIEVDTLIHDFPWNMLPQGTTFCDVGGGVGGVCIKLAKRYPKLHFVLQDLPKPLVIAEKEVWPEYCPEAISENRIEFVPLDFFKGPPKEGCAIYYMKQVIHNWTDEDCVKILTNVRKGMRPSSRLLIQDFVISPGHRVAEEEAELTQAPEPLLPNYGEGRIRQYSLDISSMLLLNAAERTLNDLIKLGELAALKFVKLWEMGDTGVAEFELWDQ